MASLQPNRFVLQSSDGKTKVDYETSSFIGQPVFNLTQGAGPVRHFAGSQIRTLSSEIGTLVSVTTHVTIDAGSTSFSVLIPAISLAGIGDQKAFTTDAIVTSHAGPVSIPFAGVHETYHFIPLKGKASFILTLFATLMEGSAQAESA
ncbi:MAG TPA: hypothetical protein VHD76_05240 [Bryobacteraceae bacterium]|jgi:hypothetical protein|nr:hypothetical protein [Bryobacteraceae bacterium]